METFTRSEVEALLDDIERARDRHDRESRDRSRWFRVALTTDIVQRSAMWDGNGWHATKAAGAHRAHVVVRIPVWLGRVLLRWAA